MAARYIVGIDLGTTNCAVAYVDTRASTGLGTAIAMFDVPQLTAPAEVNKRPMLPSFLYLPGEHDLPAGSVAVPWDTGRLFAVGEFARDQGARVPGRLVSSAKSWLCHPGVDRRAAILPWTAPADVRRLSPVQAAAEYLRHIRESWNATIAAGQATAALEHQEIVLTVPASFDEVARDLTVEAATMAGLPHITLIEEPQAAFYAWLDEHATTWSKHVTVGQIILVCDIGGGTTDFTLIIVDESGGKLAFRRLAVGDHLMLGGDNIDVALARQTELRLVGQVGKLDSVQWSGLVQSCRAAKEALLGDSAPERMPVSVPGRSSKLIAGRLQAELTRDEVASLVLDGFLPDSPWDVEPSKRPATGLQEFGLPYVADPAITRHLAAFLRRHRVAQATQPASALTRPDAVLFNGGAMKPAIVRRRILEVLSSWFRGPDTERWTPAVLATNSLDLAVARGAAHYGVVRRGGGIRIGGGTARTYYVGIESPGSDRPVSICVVPRGMEEGQELQLGDREFHLTVGKPVSFPIYTSTTRMDDQAGDVVPVDEQFMDALPPVQTTLRAGTKTSAVRTISVSLLSRYTELGTVELWCVSRQDSRRWRLQFQTRVAQPSEATAAPQGDSSGGSLPSTGKETFDESLLEQAAELIGQAFSLDGAAGQAITHDNLMKSLSDLFALGREQWPIAVLRKLWDAVAATAEARKQTPGHEQRWTNLAGFCLRPGCGYAHDDFRVNQLWRLVHTGPVFDRDESCHVQWWIMARRVAAGLAASHQEHLLSRLAPALMPAGAKSRKAAGRRPGPQELAEMWRCAASLSRIPEKPKIQLGETLLKRLRRPPHPPYALWAVARIGARVPFYGPLHTVVSQSVVAGWIEQLLDRVRLQANSPETGSFCFALALLARRSGDRHRDITDELRSRVVNRLRQLGAREHLIQLVSEVTELDATEQRIAFGESLPAGLRLVEPASAE